MRGRLVGLDALRGLSAIAVLICHIGAYWVFLRLPGKGLQLTAVGTHGVDVFVVLSGFCLALPLADRHRRLDVRQFFARRALRVLPAYWVALAGAAVGHNDYAALVRNEVQNLGLGHRVEFSGHTDDPAAALDGLSLLVHASPTPEPFGQVIVEAMIRGVPVIATDAGGALEILRPEPGGAPLGWLVAPGDADALADAMIEALSDPVEAQARAERAYRSACHRFPVSATAEAVLIAWTTAIRRD